MSKQALESEVAEAERLVKLWEETILERRKTARGFFSSPADKEDLYFSEARLRDARSQLREAKSRLDAYGS